MTVSTAQVSALRREVREFLDDARQRGRFVPTSDCWLTAFDADFSRELAGLGWVGMTIPTALGGGGRSAAERHVVAEELLAAGAPVAAHWIADRQMAPSLLKYGSAAQQQLLLPGIAAGECFFAIGMSEPDAGSDLAAVRTRATPVDGGFEVTGTKIWTSNAHRAHWMIALVRTEPQRDGRKHDGLSQVLVDLRGDDVDVRPITTMDGRQHFCEVVFDGTYLPGDRILGTAGNGWAQVTSELSFERSGPERFLSTVPLLRAWAGAVADGAPTGAAADADLGILLARLWALRRQSARVAEGIDTGAADTDLRAAIVKSQGADLERDIIDLVRRHADVEPDQSADGLARDVADATYAAPGFSLRGGTTEILRTIIAKGWLRA